ncbi:MAG: sugar ABC transporter substrate-binding protein [Candidatus Weimeria sp.]
MKVSVSKKVTVLVEIAVLAIGLLSGCGISAQGSSSYKEKIMLIGTDTNDAYRKLLIESIKSRAKTSGIIIDEQECGNDVEKQAEAARRAASSGYSAVICGLADASTAPQIEIAAGDIPVIFIDNQPDETALKADKYIYVASNDAECGRLQAEYVMKKINRKEINIVILEGEKGHSATIQITQACKNTFKSKGVTANILFEDYCNWSGSEARHKLDLFFKTNQPVDAILCNNDTMALGAVKALKDSGLDPSEILIAGVDATADGCQSIADGQMSFTVFQNAKAQADKALETATALRDGGSIKGIDGATDDLKYDYVPFEPVDASNVSGYMS